MSRASYWDWANASYNLAVSIHDCDLHSSCRQSIEGKLVETRVQIRCTEVLGATSDNSSKASLSFSNKNNSLGPH